MAGTHTEAEKDREREEEAEGGFSYWWKLLVKVVTAPPNCPAQLARPPGGFAQTYQLVPTRVEAFFQLSHQSRAQDVLRFKCSSPLQLH